MLLLEWTYTFVPVRRQLAACLGRIRLRAPSTIKKLDDNPDKISMSAAMPATAIVKQAFQ